MAKFKVTVTGRKGKNPLTFSTVVEAETPKLALNAMRAAFILPEILVVPVEDERPTLRVRNDRSA